MGALGAVAALAVVLAGSTAFGAGVTEVVGDRLEIGEPLPVIRWDGLDGDDRSYLGVAGSAGGTDGLGGEILVVEFLNTHCRSCMAQAPVMRELHRVIEADPELAGRARLLGVAQGNTAEEVRAFRGEYRLPFPVVPDPRFLAYHAFGNPGGTPYTVLCVKRDGDWVVATTHLGAITTAELLYFSMKQYRNLDASLFKGLAAELSAFRVVRSPPRLSLGDAELRAKIASAPVLAGSAPEIQRLDLPQAGRAWRVVAPGGPYFAKVFSVPPVCDICHALHFIALFDRYGEVADFVKIRISRYGNQEISEDDVAFLRGRLKGFSGFRPRRFDPGVDAVSAATMSSSLVFDALANAEVLLRDLVDAGHLSP